VEQRIWSDQVHARNRVNQAALVLYCGDSVKLRPQRVETFDVNPLLVHTGAIVVADLLVNWVAAGPAGGRLLQSSMQNLVIALLHFNKAGPFRLVGGDLRIFQPLATGVLIEVRAWVHRLIDVINAESVGRLRSCRVLAE